MYNSSIKTQTVAAIAGAKTTPIIPIYFAAMNKNKNINIGCIFINLLNAYGLTRLFSINCAAETNSDFSISLITFL